MSSGVYNYTPGDEVPVELVENATDELPERGDFVKITGDSDAVDGPQVSALDANGDLAIGQILDIPSDQNGDAQEGAATLVLTNPVTWTPVSADYADPSAGDEVVEYADGVVDVGTADTDGNSQEVPAGQVFQTVVREFGIGDKIAVARYR